MCGIVGYLGKKPAAEWLLAALSRLEYRGYDSAGVATVEGGSILCRKSVGRVEVLRNACAQGPFKGGIGIGHTRWATHGAVNERNTHPHFDVSGRIALVHNGIIENHRSIRAFLEGEGIVYRSDTDTESLVQLIGYYYRAGGDFEAAVRKALRDTQGTFGIAVVCADLPTKLFVARRGSPLLIGISEGNEYFVASDAAAIAGQATRAIYLKDNEVAVMDDDTGLAVSTIDAVSVSTHPETIEFRLEELELRDYRTYMEKEIHEQPDALRNTMRGRVDVDEARVNLGGLEQFGATLPDFERVVLTGCGTAWHACLIGEYLFEELARIPTEVEYASELRYRNPVVGPQTFSVVVSQSGETADSLAALEELKRHGAKTFGVVNVVGSSIAREAGAGAYIHVGPEVGVASTKAFTGQVTMLVMLAAEMGRRRGLDESRVREILADLQSIPEKVQYVLGLDEEIRSLAADFAQRENWLYLGRGVNYPTALEGALKLKEISYIHAEGMPAAEMKHGPLALIDRGMPVVVLAPKDHTREKVISNIEEVRGRGGAVIAVATEGDREIAGIADRVVYVPETDPLLSPLVTTVPLQLIAYHAATIRGYDVDRPRNLAKSVTVE